MKFFSKTDIGFLRSENQDRVWVSSLGGNDEAAALVVCDGMGGENAGSCASQMTLDLMRERILNGFRLSNNRNFIRNLLITSVTAANSLVYDRSRADPDKSGMGTTCVAAIVYNERAYIINVGDSRCYHIFGESMQQVTKDHTEIRRLIERGEITEAQGKNHPFRSRITRAVGASRSIIPDYFEIDLELGNCLLLCSDGLHSYGDDSEIAGIIVGNPINKCCDLLIDYALANGGRDNVTVALLQY